MTGDAVDDMTDDHPRNIDMLGLPWNINFTPTSAERYSVTYHVRLVCGETHDQ